MTTPAMRQYKEIKARYPEAVLFFRMGDFYEMFYEDARIASRVLGLALTTRSKGDDPIPLAGIPYHALDSYLAKMIRAGHRVAICEQMEDPKQAKGVVQRDVVRVVTPGTLTEETLLDEHEPNYLAAILPDGRQTGLAWVELSTGKFHCEMLTLGGACDELARLRPAECLLPEDLIETQSPEVRRIKGAISAPLVKRPPYVFDADDADRRLKNHFQVATLEGFGVSDMPAAVAAAGAVLQYLEETQRTALGHISRLQPVRRARFLYLDEATIRSLELVRTMRSESRENTLLSVFDQARTPMGGRLLRQWVQFPLADVERINARQEAVAELVEARGLRDKQAALLDEVSDLERIVARVSVGRAGPRDLLSLGRSLAQMPALKALLADRQSQRLATLQQRIDLMPDLRALLETAISPDAPANLRDGGVISTGYNAELDHLRELRAGGARWLAEFQAREAERTGISTLRVGFNQVFGYYIEISHAHAGKAPDDYIRKQTLKNAERYITPELKEYEGEVLSAQEKAQALEERLFAEVRDAAAAQTAAIQALADVVAELDLLATLADVAVRRRYVRPEVVDGLDLHIVDGRHPVVDANLGSDFVPNDCRLSADDCRMMIITGPNMAGKSTYIRQVALLVLMAQMGSFVPAREARIGVVDRIFTRVGAADELARGQSTFMVEMTETANILNNATDRSLVILDEVGRGTSTFDGLALAWAISEHLARTIGCRTLFATHYHELTELAGLLPATANHNVAVREWQDQVVFLHKIVPGGTDKSYGIHVARLAGLPRPVIERSRQVLQQLEAQHVDEQGNSRLGDLIAAREEAVAEAVAAQADGDGEGGSGGEQAAQSAPAGEAGSGAPTGDASVADALAAGPRSVRRVRRPQLSLFEDPAEVVIAALRKLNLDQMTPLEALVKLKELKDQV